MGDISVRCFSCDHRVQFTVQQHQPVATKLGNAVCAKKLGVDVGELQQPSAVGLVRQKIGSQCKGDNTAEMAVDEIPGEDLIAASV